MRLCWSRPFIPHQIGLKYWLKICYYHSFPISTWEALGRRLRRNYLWIYVVVGFSWVAKLWLFPTMATSLDEVMKRASVGPINGEIILIGSLVLFMAVIVVALGTVGLQHSSGEVLPRFEGLSAEFISSVTEAGRRGLHPKAWFRPESHKRKQLLTFIITDQPEKVSARITKDMSRGATVLAGKGAYTGEEHSVLLVALTVTEVATTESSCLRGGFERVCDCVSRAGRFRQRLCATGRRARIEVYNPQKKCSPSRIAGIRIRVNNQPTRKKSLKV